MYICQQRDSYTYIYTQYTHIPLLLYLGLPTVTNMYSGLPTVMHCGLPRARSTAMYICQQRDSYTYIYTQYTHIPLLLYFDAAYCDVLADACAWEMPQLYSTTLHGNVTCTWEVCTGCDVV